GCRSDVCTSELNLLDVQNVLVTERDLRDLVTRLPVDHEIQRQTPRMVRLPSTIGLTADPVDLEHVSDDVTSLSDVRLHTPPRRRGVVKLVGERLRVSHGGHRRRGRLDGRPKPQSLAGVDLVWVLNNVPV